MTFLKRLASFFSAPSASSGRYYYVYVKCLRCGEKIRGRVDLHNDLSIDYGVQEGEDGETTSPEKDPKYFCRKGLIGEQGCYQTVEVELTFDKNHRLLDRQIQGGKFIDEEEYLEGREQA
jgi:hypothetical protein